MCCNGIADHYGPIVLDQRVAVIYWSSRAVYVGGPAPGTTGAGSADASLVGFFLNHIGGSPYYNINSTYATQFYHPVYPPPYGFGMNVRNNVTYAQYWAANSNAPTPGSTVTDAAIRAKIAAALAGGQLAYDSNTAYLVFGDSAVNLGGGFGTQYCAYHGHFVWNYQPVRYAVMPRIRGVAGCDDLNGSPNDDAVADAELSALVHEIEEINTDPDLNAWYDNSGQENADKCAHNYGTTYQTSNGGTANVNLGGKDFLIQQNWLNTSPGSGCALSYPHLTATVLGPMNITTAGTYSWEVSPLFGTGSYTYKWSALNYEWNGPTTRVFTATVTEDFTQGPPYNGFYNYFRVSVVSGGVTWYAEIRVFVCIPTFCGGPP
jgi:hypothetical protein